MGWRLAALAGAVAPAEGRLFDDAHVAIVGGEAFFAWAGMLDYGPTPPA